MSKKLKLSPFGTFVHPWFNKPDTKYNDQGIFKSKLDVSGEPAEKFAAFLQEESEKALAEHVKEMKPADAKKWKLYVPFERLTDDDGNETGTIQFSFKQNAKVPQKDGSLKDVVIGIRDADDKPIKTAVYGGSEGRIMYSTRPIVMSSTKEVGVRLDFYQVQVTKLVRGEGMSFGKVEGGYVAEEGGADGEGPAEDQDGDY